MGERQNCMNLQIIGQLQELNFSLNEAKVYSVLLEIGETSTGEIIKKTGLHRSVVYETLNRLIEKKLVTKTAKQKISFYKVTDVANILKQIKSQEEIALDLLPKLKDLIDAKLPEITIYEGIEAYKRFWIDSIKKLPIGSTDFVAGSIGQKFWDYMGKDIEKYNKERIKRKMKLKIIAFHKDEVEADFKRHSTGDVEIHYISRNTTREGNFNILGDSLILHSSTEPLAIEIKNPNLVKVFQNIFDLLWSMGKKL
jgi:HTH-type transcriptional regulator, sugar sensing transcriptional regulator